MRRTRAHRRGEARLLAEFETAVRPGRRATLAGYAWWWRYELGLLGGLTAGAVLGVQAMGAARTLACALLIAAACALWPPWRAACLAQAWRIVTPHRLRAGCAAARIQSRNGRLPVILRTTRQPFGERARVWCPAGTTAADFRSARRVLAVACWAADVRIIPDGQHAHLVTIDVIRRRDDPPPDPGADVGRQTAPWPFSTHG